MLYHMYVYIYTYSRTPSLVLQYYHKFLKIKVDGGGWWMVVDGGGWWVVVDGGGWWHSLV